MARLGQGMVVAPQAPAVEEGVRALGRGGNATDAAVTAAFVQMVVDPQMCGVAGFGCFHAYSAERDEARIIDFNGRAGSKCRPEMWRAIAIEEYWNRYGYRLEGYVNDVGYGAIATPGTVAGLAQALAEHGTIAWADAIAPAIRYAREGFLVPPELWRRWAHPGLPNHPTPRQRLGANEAARRLYFTPDGNIYGPGARFRNPDYADTLERLAAGGPEEFYLGETGRRMAEDFEREGAFVTADDLAGYRPRACEPLATDYRGHTVTSNPPAGGGVTVLEMLNILEHEDLGALGLNSPAYIALVAKAMQAAFADRAARVGDPEFADVPTAELIGKPRAREWHGRIAGGERIAVPRFVREGPHTTHVSVVDARGNCAALTHSLGSANGTVTPGLGFMYNNLMNCFDPRPGNVNSIAPGKSRVTGIAPTIVYRDGRPTLVLGAPGGTRIITGVLQVILNRLDHGLSATEAVAAPRFDAQGDILDCEARIPSWTTAALAERGFTIQPNPAPYGNFALVQAIALDHERGRLDGGADPRSGGAVMTSDE